MAMSSLLLTSSGTAAVAAAAATPLTRDQIYTQGGFLQNWIAPMPSSPIQTTTANPTNNGERYLVQNWATTFHSIQIGGQDISFVSDPFKAAVAANSTAASSSNSTTSTTSGKGDENGTVLQLNYPKGSYAPSVGPVTGGTHFYAKPFGDKTPFSKMLVSYDVAFPAGFNWVLAGKLPGIYGGTPYDGCSGGVQSTGVNCLTMRMMWRQNGIGEVYAYVPADPKSAFCRDSQVLCNDQYGKSIGRGQIYFQPGVWTRLDMAMELNEPAGNSNGSESTYATPVDTAVYFRNVQLSVGAPAKLYEGTGGNGAPGKAMIGGSSWTILGATSGFVFESLTPSFLTPGAHPSTTL
ncbi:hypothetical protein BG015_011356 [Linnemannia schmuckeri]|uniref:Polysaccharide lyase 14 domain-containing protein n=1 Tax=Linnemannia schmuckeri TaxID=64567 RepID=A0A9P5RSU2_9FUNG|nr:hypothetical protein BG015_011356 [Linnemannia schmuckeri]